LLHRKERRGEVDEEENLFGNAVVIDF